MVTLFPDLAVVTFVGPEQIVNKWRIHRKKNFAVTAGQEIKKQNKNKNKNEEEDNNI